ncbi:histone deacetylase [Naegleria gruberi]|uniref:histone deacetylase n=1 Tax=Naegleria gruberi TaxID=5762 RepID=D2VZE4_NAEGR|nr:histone deacetylase [Naegleria gruberi]EFC37777.1 histone deacetylase [Naegleria gruberi]|eukprot:XP_002670521.1 histone deacetylase [Naegleria gruberi strain NEG-M]
MLANDETTSSSSSTRTSQGNSPPATIKVRTEDGSLEGEFRVREIKSKKLPSFLSKKRKPTSEQDENNSIGDVNKDQLEVNNMKKYKVDMQEIESYFNMDDCILHQECGRKCMVMDGSVNPSISYIVTGTKRSNEIVEEIPFDPKMKRTVIMFDKRMGLHMGRGSHPESPARLSGIWSFAIEEFHFDKGCTIIEGRKATREELEWTHSPHHVDAVMASHLEMFNFSTDVFVGEQSGDAARVASGGLIEIATKVMNGEFDNGFAIIRPPGHHCYFDKASGFCIVNNVAVAANVLVKRSLAKRIVIVDWDVHHGNGTQAILEDQFKERFDNCNPNNDEKPEIIFFSLHQTKNNFYPKTGTLEQIAYEGAKKFIFNIPFDETYGDQEILNAFEQIIMPIASNYNPDIVLVSAGFDAVKGDKLGGQLCSQQLFGHLTCMLKTLANGKIVLALEGGYNIQETAGCVKECVSVLCGQEPQGLSSLFQTMYLKEEQIEKHSNMMERVKQFYSAEFNKMDTNL